MLSYHFDWSIITSGTYHDWLVSGVIVTLKLSAHLHSAFLYHRIADCGDANEPPIGPCAGLPISTWNSSVTPRFWCKFFSGILARTGVLPMFVNDWLNEVGFEFAAAVIALSIYTSAFIAEDIRSGVLSIPKEQMEAARSAGFSYLQSMRSYHFAPGGTHHHSTID